MSLSRTFHPGDGVSLAWECVRGAGGSWETVSALEVLGRSSVFEHSPDPRITIEALAVVGSLFVDIPSDVPEVRLVAAATTFPFPSDWDRLVDILFDHEANDLYISVGELVWSRRLM